MGIDPNKQDFKSQEEQQQYMQMLEEEKSKIVSPAQIEKEMKDWKTKPQSGQNMLLKKISKDSIWISWTNKRWKTT